ncbi:MAG: proline racemase family protein [Vicinamibacteria bacterium]
MITSLRTIDAHTAGEPLRLVTEGMPSPEGRTMLEKRAWAAKRVDHLRRALMLEPRGHTDMYGALITEPERAGSDAGLLFMHNEGWSTMCGHGVIAVATIALERGLIWKASEPPLGAGEEREVALAFDVPAGLVRARATLVGRREGVRVSEVAFTNVPSFVLAGGVGVTALGRTLRVDVAFGGAFYAIVDAEAAGLSVESARLPELRRMGMAVKAEVERLVKVQHPEDAGLHGLYGTIFTAPPREPDAHLRNVTVFADAEVDRSPCGSGTAAVMAVLDELGLVGDEGPFIHESIVGTLFRGRVSSRTRVGDLAAIVPEIAGSAWITGEHTFLIDGDDPLRAGFRV